MAVETLLSRALGEQSGMLHTARSRNDQIALDLRLHVREQCASALQELSTLLGALAGRAERERDTLLPGTRTRQRAQPVSAAYYLCAWGAMFARDLELLRAAAAPEMPLGVARSPGPRFPSIARWSASCCARSPDRQRLDTVGDRDFALDFATRPRACCCTRAAWRPT